MCGALLEKISNDLVSSQTKLDDMHYCLDESHAEDLQINSIGRCVRTRLYFTSESHLISLLNVLRYPADGNESILSPEGIEIYDNIRQLSYLTHVVFRLFEDRSDCCNDEAMALSRIEILLSPGAIDMQKTHKLAPYSILTKSLKCVDLLKCLRDAIELVHTRKNQ